jgi:hypothetical protein
MMMDTRQEAYVAGFKAEHRELHDVLRNVDRAWRVCETHDWTEADCGECCGALTALKDHLTHHFAQEEAGGYLEEALTLAPRLGATADRLLAQHPVLLARCAELVELARRSGADKTAQRRLHEKFPAMRKLLLEHERGENAVMQEAYHVDLENGVGK